jgi:probable addiction module antidote protein
MMAKGNIVHTFGDTMEINTDKIDECVLALLWLTLHDEFRAWKSFDWDAMDRLHQKGFIGSPANKAKSVVLTESGMREAEQLFQKIFGSEQHSRAKVPATEMTMAKIKTRPWDAAETLRTNEDIADYLEAALEDGDPALIATALGNIARARGMTQLARDTGLGRESLYKALSPTGNPEFATMLKVIRALGLKLHAQPAH